MHGHGHGHGHGEDVSKARIAQEKSWKLLQEARGCLGRERIGLEDSNMMLTFSDGVERAEYVKPVLEWLYVTRGKVCADQLAELAGTYAYDTIHVIDVGSMDISTDSVAAGVCWMGASRIPSGPVVLASHLQRLKIRFQQRRQGGRSIVLLSYDGSTSYLTLHALALFFFMYCHFDQGESRSLAAAAVEKQIPPVSILESGIEELAVCGKGWLQRIRVQWPYNATSSVNIAGDIVGGWHITKKLHHHAPSQKWKIQVWGLSPGSYTFKFVVDGKWCVDLSEPLSHDEFGNNNNTVSVLACGGVSQDSYLMGDGMAGPPLASSHRESVDQKMVVVVEQWNQGESVIDHDDSSHDTSAQDRLRLARFGAAILSYYKKISVL